MKTIGRRRREDDGTLIEGRAGTRFWKMPRAGRTVDKVFVVEGARIGDVAVEARWLRRAGRHLRPPQARPYMSPNGNHLRVIAQAAAQEYVPLRPYIPRGGGAGRSAVDRVCDGMRTHDTPARSSARRKPRALHGSLSPTAARLVFDRGGRASRGGRLGHVGRA